MTLTSDQRYAEIRAQAERAAGPLASLRMRARGYLDVYRACDSQQPG